MKGFTIRINIRHFDDPPFKETKGAIDTNPVFTDFPDWANWIAVDGSGHKCFHEEKPTMALDRWISSKKICFVDNEIHDSKYWQYSLEEINR